ncbi:hypothetical protein D3C80_717000 [compost metagenome]
MEKVFLKYVGTEFSRAFIKWTKIKCREKGMVVQDHPLSIYIAFSTCLFFQTANLNCRILIERCNLCEASSTLCSCQK